jgi:hypothetical protein
MTQAYLRRVQYEARVQAVALLAALAEATKPQAARRIPPDEMLRQMGVG